VSGYRADGALCVVLLTYVKPLDEVDALMADHVAWLDRGFAEGAFVVAGRRNPRTGGVIMMRGDAASVAEIAATDPFVTGGVATVEVVAFNASFAQPAIKGLLG
jgi:uncharacterized protein YciI